jgi:hypothetical protein
MVSVATVRHTAFDADWQVSKMSRYAFPLRGYENASVWGHDEATASYWADLWANTSDSRDDPDISVSWFTGQKPVDTPLDLATLISARTGKATHTVVRAMAFAEAAPEAPILREMAEVLASPA